MKWLTRVFGTVWLLGGVVIFLIYFNSLNWDWDWETGWSTLAACATWVLAGGIVLVFWQIVEARRSTNAEVAVELFRGLRSAEMLETLRFIYRLKPKDIRNLHAIDKNNIESVLDKFELLGALVKQGIIDDRLAIEAYGGPPVLKCWYQLGENYIKEIRKQRGLFCKYVEDFARRTMKYQIKHAPKDEWVHFLKETPVKRDEDRINLIETLKDELLSPRERRQAMCIRHLRSIYKPALRNKKQGNDGIKCEYKEEV